MPRTQVACPQCKNPTSIEVQQIFDLNIDPTAKQKLLNGIVNVIQCPVCGYNGMVGLPIIYHDPEKELLLTFYPSEIGRTLDEQEKQLGPLINKVIDNLPQEKRKAYVLQPQSMLTFQTLLEKILAADGITKEMLEDQQKKIDLLQRLLSIPDEGLQAIIDQEKDLFDMTFFSILSRLLQSAAAQGDKNSVEKLQSLQTKLFETTETGKELQAQVTETQEVIKTLQEASKDGLTQEKLLDVILNAKTESKISTIVNFIRNGLDYQFFQLLSQKIDNTEGKEKDRLLKLRENLLEMTTEIDKKVQEEIKVNKALLEKIIQQENIEEATQKNLNQISEIFIHIIEDEIKKGRKDGDLDRIQKLERVMIVIQKAMEPPEEIKLIESLIEKIDKDEDFQELLNENVDKITPEFLQLLNSVISQAENQKDESFEKISEVYKKVLRFSMKKNLQS